MACEKIVFQFTINSQPCQMAVTILQVMRNRF